MICRRGCYLDLSFSWDSTRWVEQPQRWKWRSRQENVHGRLVYDLKKNTLGTAALVWIVPWRTCCLSFMAWAWTVKQAFFILRSLFLCAWNRPVALARRKSPANTARHEARSRRCVVGRLLIICGLARGWALDTVFRMVHVKSIIHSLKWTQK